MKALVYEKAARPTLEKIKREREGQQKLVP
jgi:hypothetical protein